MIDALDELVSLMSLEQLDTGKFTGRCLETGTGRVYGGQVIGQALKAAQMTIDQGKAIHSMHAYFLRPGDFREPILYKVDITRNGRSFSTRRVVAIQRDKPIFITAASFQIEESGLDYQPEMPQVAGPESVKSLSQYDPEERGSLPEKLHSVHKLSAPFDLRPLPEDDPAAFPEGNTGPRRYVWLKTAHALEEDPDLHRAILAYISDYGLIGTALIPHEIEFDSSNLQLASIDHAMWYLRPFRVDQWLLYVCEAVTTSNARGLARGYFYNLGGSLVATTVQEGLIRQV